MSQFTAALALAGVLLGSPFPGVLPRAPRVVDLTVSVRPMGAEARIVTLINRDRAHRGLPALRWDPSLCVAGRQHSIEMARLAYFDHSSPIRGSETPADRWERIADTIPDEYTIAENIFYGSVPDVGWAHRSLMESEGHRENILSPEYSRVGVGIYIDRAGRMWITEMFLS